MQQDHLSPQAHQRLSEELEERSGPRRREISEKIERARELGDISENGDYDAAKNEQGLNEARTVGLCVRKAAEARGYRKLAPVLRVQHGQTYRTDNGNYIYDCPFGAIVDAALLATALSLIPGVVDHGLFVGMASALVLAGESGVRVIERK